MKVGDYVRTNDRGIRRIGKIIDDLFYRDKEDNLHQKGNLIKSSPNIIDLIEYDDILKIIYEDKEYICKVVDIGGIRGVQLTSTLSVGLGIVEAGIKSIVTKEQFESMEYKLGE